MVSLAGAFWTANRNMDQPQALRQRTRPLVLIVDGHDDTFPLYSIALFATGFDVAAVADAEQAYDRALKLMSPNIILTEWPMPTGAGWAFLNRLRDDARTRDVLVVALSAQRDQLEPEPTEQRVAQFFPNPCPPYALVMGLRRLLDRQQH